MPQHLNIERALGNDRLFASEQHREGLRPFQRWRAPVGNPVNFRLMIGRAAARDRHPFVVDLMVPPTLQNLGEFYDAYAKLQSDGYVVCVNEYPVTEFRFFLDLDFPSGNAPRSNSVLLAALAFLFRLPSHCTVKILQTGQEEERGYHIVVPELIVTSRQMLRRIAEANERAGENVFYNSVMDAADSGPYSQGSPHLRAPGCFKLWPSRMIAEAEARPYRLSARGFFDEAYNLWTAENVDAWDFPPGSADYADCFISALLAEDEHLVSGIWKSDGYGVIPCPVSYGRGVFDMDWRDCRSLEIEKIEEIVSEYCLPNVIDAEILAEVNLRVVEYINTCAVKVVGANNMVIWKNHDKLTEMSGAGLHVNPVMMPQYCKQAEFITAFSHMRHTFKLLQPQEEEEDDGRGRRRGPKPKKFKELVQIWPSVWANHPKVRCYNGVHQRSAPLVGTAAGKIFNEWVGGGVYFDDAMKFVYADVPKAIEAVTFFRNFLREVICGDPDEDPVYNRYFYYVMIHFLINEVKTPHKKFYWLIFLWSRQQGVGKGRLHELLTALVGATNVFSTVGMEKVAGRFTAYSAKATLVLVDEADMESMSTPDRKALQANFKKMVTDNKLVVEAKYRDPETVGLYASFLVTSNLPLPIPHENRRELAAYVNPCRLGDSEYWAEFSRILFDEEGWKAVAAWIYGMEPSVNYKNGTKAVLGRARVRCSQGTAANAVEAFLSTWFRSDKAKGPNVQETVFQPDSGTWVPVDEPMVDEGEELPEAEQVGLAGDFSPLSRYFQAKVFEQPFGHHYDHCNQITNWWLKSIGGYLISTEALNERILAFDPSFRKGDLNKTLSDALGNCAFICSNGVFELDIPWDKEEAFWAFTWRDLQDADPNRSEAEVRAVSGHGIQRRVHGQGAQQRITLIQKGIYHHEGLYFCDNYVALKDKATLKAAFNTVSGYQRTPIEEIPDLGIDDEYYLDAWPTLGFINNANE